MTEKKENFNNEVFLKLNKQIEKPYSDFLKYKAVKALESFKNFKAIDAKYQNPSFIPKDEEKGADYWKQIEALCDMKYLNANRHSLDKIYFLDFEKLDIIFEKIRKHKSVMFFDKLLALKSIDLYYDLRIKISVMREDFEGKDKNKNNIFNLVSNALNYDSSKVNSINVSPKDFEKEFTKSYTYSKLKKAITTGLTKAENGLGINFDTMDLESHKILTQKILKGTKLNVKTIETSVFPDLYECFGEYFGAMKIGLPTKRKLLYDIFPVILSGQFSFETEESWDAGKKSAYDSYYAYQISKVKGIIDGK